jgi:hypothetical protein
MKPILILSIIAAIILGTNAYISTITINGPLEITGYGTSGYINVSVSRSVSVNFTSGTINWGAGSITASQNNATLETSTPSVARGNWSESGISGFIIENIGAANVSLTLSTTKNASTLLGGSDSHRRYQWNISSNEEGSCNPQTLSNSTWVNVNTTGYTFCNQLGYIDTQDAVRIDILMTIPYDGNTGVLADTVTATVTAS